MLQINHAYLTRLSVDDLQPCIPSYCTHTYMTMLCSLVEVRFSLDTNEAVLFTMVQPVACPACTDEPVQLIGLHPDQLINSVIAPDLQTFSTQLHSTA